MKNAGCNHMTCHRCHCDWCWKCGSKYWCTSRHKNHIKNPFSGCFLADGVPGGIWTNFLWDTGVIIFMPIII